MANIGSTFGIDIRRKIFVDGDGCTLDWLKGELDPSCVKNIAWSFTEELTSATEQYGEAYDELTAGLREALKSFTKLLRGVSSGKPLPSISSESGSDSKSTQAALMEAAGAIAAFTNTDTADDILQQAFNIAPMYNIPARSKVPQVNLPIMGSGLKINFAYGKAGLFNARTEVYEPIRNIMESLSPSITKSSVPGLISITGSSTLPFEFQSKYYFIKNAASLVKGSTIKDNIKALAQATKSVTSDGKEAAKIQAKIDKARQSQSELEGKMVDSLGDMGDAGKDIEVNQLLTGEKDVNAGWWAKLTGAPAAKVKASVKAWQAKEKEITGFEKAPTDTTGGKYNDEPDKLKEQYGNRYGGGSLYEQKAQVMDKVAESGGGLVEVLSSIATIRPKLVGMATTQQYTKIASCQKNFQLMLSPSFNPKKGEEDTVGGCIYFSIESIKEKVDKQEITPLLQICAIPTQVEASFDYSNVDENGYPMSGSISIKKLWSVQTYGAAVTLQGSKVSAYIAADAEDAAEKAKMDEREEAAKKRVEAQEKAATKAKTQMNEYKDSQGQSHFATEEQYLARKNSLAQNYDPWTPV